MEFRMLHCTFINGNSLVTTVRKHFLKVFIDDINPDVVPLADHKLSAGKMLEINGYKVASDMPEAISEAT